MEAHVLIMAIIFTILTITCIVVIVMNTIVLAKLADAADRISSQFATFGTQLSAFNATAQQLSSDIQGATTAATAIGDQIGSSETAITDALTSAESTITSALTTAGTAAGGAVLLLGGKITANTTALDALTAQLQATPP